MTLGLRFRVVGRERCGDPVSGWVVSLVCDDNVTMSGVR
jgi:hypothetical protein